MVGKEYFDLRDARARIAELESKVADLQQFHDWAKPQVVGEWICKRCGIRQDDPTKAEPAF